MEKMSNEKDIALSSEYEYGFHDEDVSVYKTQKGLNEETVRTISKIKNEPEWMLQLRLDAYHSFEKQQNPNWGPDLSEINFDDYTYYIKPSDKQEKSWDEVPDTIRNTFDKLGIPEAEQKFLAGVSTQYESISQYVRGSGREGCYLLGYGFCIKGMSRFIKGIFW